MNDDTQDLLGRWHEGDRAALELLLEAHLPWVQKLVSRRLGPLLRARGETQDYLQDTMVEVLSWTPSFRVEDVEVFRRLLARLVENVLRDKSDWYRAQRRALERERPLSRESVLDLDAPVRRLPGPATVVAEGELAGRVRLALELLGEDERRIVLWKQWEGRAWADIGERLGVTPDAARMRGHRALLRLTEVVERLAAGDLEKLLAESESS